MLNSDADGECETYFDNTNIAEVLNSTCYFTAILFY